MVALRRQFSPQKSFAHTERHCQSEVYTDCTRFLVSVDHEAR